MKTSTNIFLKSIIIRSVHTVVIEREHVEFDTAGLHADVAVNVLSPCLMDSDGVLQRLHTGL